MSIPRSPDEFEIAEAQADYDAWLRAKISKSLGDQRPTIPNDQMIAKMDLLIDRIKGRHLGA